MNRPPDVQQDKRQHKSKGPRIAFRLGAGVSTPPAPNTDTLTAELLEAERHYFRHTDGAYHSSGAGKLGYRPPGIPEIEKVMAFLQVLEQHVRCYYHAPRYPGGCVERKPNYEDSAYLAV